MFAVKSSAEFIDGVKALDEKLVNAKLKSIEIDKNNSGIKYSFICDQAIDESLKQKILEYIERSTLKAFENISVKIIKIASNSELIGGEIFRFLNDNYPSISIFLKPTDIACKQMGNVCKYTLSLSEDGAKYVAKNGALKKLNEYLSNNFCSEFVGETAVKEQEDTISLIDEEVYEKTLEKIEYRTIKVNDVCVIDDLTLGDTAVYIEDVTSGTVTLCGTITDIVERKTKNDKPFFIIHINDTTATTSGVYFTRKSTYDKIKLLAVGDDIICRCNIGEYNGKRSLTFDKINRCTFPKDFVKKDKYKKKAPPTYSLIFPEKATTVKVSSVFDELVELPNELTSKTYVVFDLETTGLDVMSNGITEIGAVKIIDGKIKEQFTTLVNPGYFISEENVAITGITAEMVKDSPKISEVLPDFMKFIEGSVLVAQNSSFDMKFIKRFANAEEYEVNNKVLDTVEISRQVLPQLRKNDLKTLAEHFGIVFRHHRALSDAYATAEIFIELIKIKNSKK